MFTKINLIFLTLAMMTGCGDSYRDKATRAAKEMAKDYYSLLSQNKIREACLYIDEKSGRTEQHGPKCDDGSALIFSRIDSVGPFVTYRVAGGTSASEAVEDYSFADVVVTVSVTYENANLYEHFHVYQGENVDATLDFFCMDPIDGKYPSTCW